MGGNAGGGIETHSYNKQSKRLPYQVIARTRRGTKEKEYLRESTRKTLEDTRDLGGSRVALALRDALYLGTSFNLVDI